MRITTLQKTFCALQIPRRIHADFITCSSKTESRTRSYRNLRIKGTFLKIRIARYGGEFESADYTLIYNTSTRISRLFVKVWKHWFERLYWRIRIFFLICTIYGFDPGRSGTTQQSPLLQILDKWIDIIDQVDVIIVNVIYLDFAKAFDSVPHHRLITKLQSYIEWMNRYWSGSSLFWVQGYREYITRRRYSICHTGHLWLAEYPRGRSWDTCCSSVILTIFQIGFHHLCICMLIIRN